MTNKLAARVQALVDVAFAEGCRIMGGLPKEHNLEVMTKTLVADIAALENRCASQVIDELSEQIRQRDATLKQVLEALEFLDTIWIDHDSRHTVQKTLNDAIALIKPMVG